MNARWILFLGLVLGLMGCGGDAAVTDGGTAGRDADRPDTDGGTTRDGGTTPTDGGTTLTDGGTTTTDFTCSTGILLAGHPTFDSDVGNRALEGDPLAGVMNRPMLYRELVFVGTHMVTVTGQEVWSSDLSAALPIVHRVAGNEGGQALADGPCASARFANLQDLAVDSAGAIYVMDQTANAVLKITDPFTASCAVSYWAGTSVDTPDLNPSIPPNVGETQGPGLSAQFALPARMAIDASDNLYVWDEGNASIRKIANDSAHTVSTLAPVVSLSEEGTPQDVIVDALAVLGSDLYLYGHDTSGQIILEAIALSTGARRDIFRDRGDSFPDFGGGSRQPGGMTTDGVDLFMYFKGIVYRVTTAGVVTRIAGDPEAMYNSEFDDDFDPAVSHPALETQLPTLDQFSTAGAGSWLSIDNDDNLYFTGSVQDPYITRLTCGR